MGKRVATWWDMSYCPIDIVFTSTSGSESGSMWIVVLALQGWILGFLSKSSRLEVNIVIDWYPFYDLDSATH